MNPMTFANAKANAVRAADNKLITPATRDRILAAIAKDEKAQAREIEHVRKSASLS